MAGSLGVAAAGFLPWTQGGRPRSGLELTRTLREVGLAPRGALGLLLALFLFTPAVAAGVWIAALTRRLVLAGALGVLAGVLAVTAAFLFEVSRLRGAGGVDVALFAGIAALLGGLGLLAQSARREGNP